MGAVFDSFNGGALLIGSSRKRFCDLRNPAMVALKPRMDYQHTGFPGLSLTTKGEKPNNFYSFIVEAINW